MANVRYTQEKRIQVAEYVLDGRYSASVASKVFGIGVNTVCRWVNRLCEKRGHIKYLFKIKLFCNSQGAMS
jgi:transposase